MGEYRIPEATATLVIDDGPYAGAEIEVRLTLSPRVYFGIKQWAGQTTADMDATMAATREIATLFVEHGLIGWNLPVPATLDGLLSLDVGLITKIAATWISAIGSVPVPLPEASPTGSGSTARRNGKRRRSTGGSSTGASSPTTLTGTTSGDSSAFSLSVVTQ